MRDTVQCLAALGLAALMSMASGCATRPTNRALDRIDVHQGYRPETHLSAKRLADTQILITFSGGGTRAAAFAYGVLEELRRTFVDVQGQSIRILDEVDFITGVSGGSFTALAYGLYGDRLFDEYEQRFLKRDVQSALVQRMLSPVSWGRLASSGVGRSEVAADYYDEILFEGATFGDLMQRQGPLIMPTSTDISTGARLAFSQADFDAICSDLAPVRLARAAATSSAVPVILSPVTFDNHGGRCGYQPPAWANDIGQSEAPAGRVIQRQREMQSFANGLDRPFLHLVDGGVADNLGLRAILERFQQAEFSEQFRRQLHIERLRRTLVIVVNARSDPSTDWDRSERGPTTLGLLLKSISVPIDRNSYETLELLRDMMTRWKTTAELNRLRSASSAKAFDEPAATRQPGFFYADVSFDEVADPTERGRLKALPTSFSLPVEDVDSLRRAASETLRNSASFKAFLADIRQNP